ncbi:hypothetical protein [uncultured Mailhella sp.]|uniref:hypothetical protein n=1 Tax=uncultured Mailhella sp. TaxID=1981031 RepID=UPI0025DC2C7B|nr:hypothetical protein [uncultured Mailhella sp.]
MVYSISPSEVKLDVGNGLRRTENSRRIQECNICAKIELNVKNKYIQLVDKNILKMGAYGIFGRNRIFLFKIKRRRSADFLMKQGKSPEK